MVVAATVRAIRAAAETVAEPWAVVVGWAVAATAVAVRAMGCLAVATEAAQAVERVTVEAEVADTGVQATVSRPVGMVAELVAKREEAREAAVTVAARAMVAMAAATAAEETALERSS